MDSTQDMEPTNANGMVSETVVQQNSLNTDAASNSLDLLLKRLEQLEQKIDDPRRIQSEKDKLFSAVEKDKRYKLIEGYKEIRKLQSEGYSDREIEQELRLREMENTQVSANNTGSVVQGNNVQTVKILVDTLGLNVNDPDVLKIMMINSQEDQILKLSELAKRKKQETSPALVTQPPSGTIPQTDLMSEYQQAIKGLRGEALINKKMEYRKKGLNIS